PREVHPRCGPPPTVHTPRSDDRFSGFAEKQTSLSDDSTPENLLSCVCPPPGSFLCSRRSPNRKPPMRLIPSTPLAPLGAAVAAVVLLSGCEGSDFDFDFDLDTDFFSSDSEESPDPSADPSPGEEGEEEEQASNHGLPDSCEAAGVTEVVGDLAPGTVLDEESGEVEGVDDAEQLVCTLGDGSGE